MGGKIYGGKDRGEEGGDRRCSEESCLTASHQVGVPVFLSDVISGGSSPAQAAAPPGSRLRHVNVNRCSPSHTHTHNAPASAHTYRASSSFLHHVQA